MEPLPIARRSHECSSTRSDCPSAFRRPCLRLSFCATATQGHARSISGWSERRTNQGESEEQSCMDTVSSEAIACTSTLDRNAGAAVSRPANGKKARGSTSKKTDDRDAQCLRRYGGQPQRFLPDPLRDLSALPRTAVPLAEPAPDAEVTAPPVSLRPFSSRNALTHAKGAFQLIVISLVLQASL